MFALCMPTEAKFQSFTALIEHFISRLHNAQVLILPDE